MGRPRRPWRLAGRDGFVYLVRFLAEGTYHGFGPHVSFRFAHVWKKFCHFSFFFLDFFVWISELVSDELMISSELRVSSRETSSFFACSFLEGVATRDFVGSLGSGGGVPGILSTAVSR